MTRRRLLLALLVVIVVVGGGGAYLLWPRGTSEVTEEEALDDFRDRADDDPSGGAGVPEPGVYRFRADGEERVQLGPLPAEDRPLPDEVTVVVVDSGDGCFEWTVNLFAEHTEDTSWCIGDDGTLTLDGHVKHQQIGALSPTATMTCDPAVLVPPDGSAAELACELELSGGPAAITASLAGTATTGPPEPIAVGGDTVEAVPVTIAYEVSGGLSGTWDETLWLTDEHLPVRIERALDLSGPATFTETSALELVELTPAR